MAKEPKQRVRSGRNPRSTTRIRLILVFLIGVGAGAVAGFLATAAYFGNWPFGVFPALPAAMRPEAWAQPIGKLGLPNLHRVTQDLYRGAKPTTEGMGELEKMGIKTIVNLQSFHSDKDELEGTALEYVHISMRPHHPEDEEVIRFLKVVTDEKRTPVFVHCEYGADRTGTICAIYRIAVQGWSKEEAIREMTKGGFGFHKAWTNLIKYVRELDVDQIKQRAGLQTSTVPAITNAHGS